jgi:heptosyltransferase II
MNVLIIKLGATGDVVRTTPLLRRLNGDFTWITAAKNQPLLENIAENLRAFSWEERHLVSGAKYDLVINLEDERDMAAFLRELHFRQLFGAYLTPEDKLAYTDDSHRWFDLSLISVHGREQADQLKLRNRATYQELIFESLGLTFMGEKYLLPSVPASPLRGDIAISREAGPVWPMKNWAYYDELQRRLEAKGFKVNVLGTRPSLLEHLADVQGHRLLVSGDSLPMHLALGSGVKCVSLFTCTSPWEIFDYGIQTKLISPLLEEFFYKRFFDARATTAISVDEVFNAVLAQLGSATDPVAPAGVSPAVQQ